MVDRLSQLGGKVKPPKRWLIFYHNLTIALWLLMIGASQFIGMTSAFSADYSHILNADNLYATSHSSFLAVCVALRGV